MILTITYTGTNTADISHLFFKHPERPQTFPLSFGKAHVFYPELSDPRTTIALLLDIDPIDLARGKAGSLSGGLFDYVNDRPYVSSSFMSTAISRVFGTAMTGRADDFQQLADSPLALTAAVTMLPCKSQPEMLNRVFEPLGYQVSWERFLADEAFPEWGDAKYVNLQLKGQLRLRELLTHLYVLIPVFDRQKHYWVGKDEVDKLIRHGEGWLSSHPAKDYIAARYLNQSRGLVNRALDRLNYADTESGSPLPEEPEEPSTPPTMTLNSARLARVAEEVEKCGASRVIDLGCGEGRLLSRLLKNPRISCLTGTDVAYSVLEKAKARLKVDRMSERDRERLNLFQSSLTYRDARFSGYDAACVVEVIEHLDPARLQAFEQVLFQYAKPTHVILTTPNFEYNANYKSLTKNSLRHGDHRFEWTRAQFREWAEKVAQAYNYKVSISEIGESDEKNGTPTQIGVFTLCG